MKSAKKIVRRRSRLTRKESKSLTRAKLVAVAKIHFLKHGFVGAVLEEIAEEAGFSRGALYANFEGKEELFLAVFDEELGARIAKYRAIAHDVSLRNDRLLRLREYFTEQVADSEWGNLRTEFELGAVHSEKLRKRFIQIHRRDLENAVAIASRVVDMGDISPGMPVERFVLAIQSFMQGFALKQKLLGSELSASDAKAIGTAFFDRFVVPSRSPGSE